MDIIGLGDIRFSRRDSKNTRLCIGTTLETTLESHVLHQKRTLFRHVLSFVQIWHPECVGGPHRSRHVMSQSVSALQ
jgi:hypothetical protein